MNSAPASKVKSNSRLVTYKGETKSLTEWAAILGFKRTMLRHRLDKGWDVEAAFTTPVKVQGEPTAADQAPPAEPDAWRPKAGVTNVPALTQEELKAVFAYSPDTGIFTYVDDPGQVAGKYNEKGYLRIDLNGHTYQGHRLAWLYMTGVYPEEDIDHKNWNPSDNRFDNLRLASMSMNMANLPLTKKNTTGAKGVFLEPWGRYRARLYLKGRGYYGGHHDTLDEAAHAYNKLAIQHFGEFAVLNPIGADK
jgi:hypothetical protein